jgi:hypothetical protein
MIDLAAAKERALRLAGDEPIEWGRFLAIDEELQRAGAPPVSRFMAESYREFYRSGATTLCQGIGQRGTKSTTAMRAATLPEILLSPYAISSGATPVWPIVSANMTEASERIKNLEYFLKLLGYVELPRRTKTADKIGLSQGQFVVVGGLDLHMLDGCDNAMIIRVTARELGAVSGFTGRGSALCDEVALWDSGEENARKVPVADAILETLSGRGARQGDTKLLLVGRLFSPGDPLSARCRDGSTADRYVQLLGDYGAELDWRARQWLAKRYEREALRAPTASKRALYSGFAEDPRLHEPPNPLAYAIPGWSAFPDGPEREGCPSKRDAPESPERAIAECRRLAAAAARNARDELDGLFRAYGSRGWEAGAHAWIDRECCEAIRRPPYARAGAALQRYAAIDTGSSRNATVLVVGESRVTRECPAERPLWAITGLWRWQGTTGRPIDHRLVVGPAAGRILRERGISVLAADGYERGPLLLGLEGTGITLRIQGGELGPSPDGRSIGVYGHGRIVIHERRLVVELDDESEVEELVRGLASVQCEAGRVWLPADGDSHHDSTAAVLRLLWHAGAGDSGRKPRGQAGGASPYAALGASDWYP